MNNPHKHTEKPDASRPSRRSLPSGRLLLVLFGTCLSGLAAAAPGSSVYHVMAPVISVDPIVRQQQIERPVQHCTDYRAPQVYYDDRYEQRHDRHERRFMPSLIGGLVGGLVGNQFGGGSGKKILTVVGALAGSSIANDIANERRRQRTYAEPVRRNCYTTYERENVETIDGYHVVYEYAGQEFSKTLPEHPGDQVRVMVEVAPGASL